MGRLRPLRVGYSQLDVPRRCGLLVGLGRARLLEAAVLDAIVEVHDEAWNMGGLGLSLCAGEVIAVDGKVGGLELGAGS